MQTSLHSSLPGRGRSITFLVAKNGVYLKCGVFNAFLSRDDSTSPRTPHLAPLNIPDNYQNVLCVIWFNFYLSPTCNTSSLSLLVNSLAAASHDDFFSPKKMGVLEHWRAGEAWFRALTGIIALCS